MCECAKTIGLGGFFDWCDMLAKIITMDLKMVIFRLNNIDLGAKFGLYYKYGPIIHTCFQDYKNGSYFGGFCCTPLPKRL